MRQSVTDVNGKNYLAEFISRLPARMAAKCSFQLLLPHPSAGYVVMDLSRINLNLLLSLHWLLHHRSVTKAATALHISQPAASKNLAQLRELLDDPLLIRIGNEMQRSAYGEQLYAKLPELLGQLENLFQPSAFDPLQYQGRFNIAVTDYITQHILPEMIGQLSQQAAGIKLHFRLWEPGMISDLREGRLDLAACILDQLPEDIQGQQVGGDNFHCLMRRDHPLSGADMTLEDYVSAEHIGVTGGGDKIRMVDEALAEQGLRRHLKLTVPFTHSALAITACSDCLLTVPRHIALHLGPEYNLASQPLPVKVPDAQYYLIWHQRQQEEAAHRYLRELLFQALSQSRS